MSRINRFLQKSKQNNFNMNMELAEERFTMDSYVGAAPPTGGRSERRNSSAQAQGRYDLERRTRTQSERAASSSKGSVRGQRRPDSHGSHGTIDYEEEDDDHDHDDDTEGNSEGSETLKHLGLDDQLFSPSPMDEKR